jgi:hypothetical protein
MTIKDMKIIESLKQIRPKDLIYSGILVLFMVIVGVLFFVSTRFISQNINKVFSTEGAEGVQALDLARYMLVAKKLGIEVSTPSEGVAVPTAVIPTPTTLTPTVQAVATLDKKTLTIEVRNSTAKKGAASALAKSLTDAGFTTPATGNENTLYPATTILVKESKRDYAPLILAEVSKAYPDAVTATTTESAAFDVTVIIGGK